MTQMGQIQQQGQKLAFLRNNISTLNGLLMLIFGFQVSNEFIYPPVKELYQILDFGEVITC